MHRRTCTEGCAREDVHRIAGDEGDLSPAVFPHSEVVLMVRVGWTEIFLSFRVFHSDPEPSATELLTLETHHLFWRAVRVCWTVSCYIQSLELEVLLRLRPKSLICAIEKV